MFTVLALLVVATVIGLMALALRHARREVRSYKLLAETLLLRVDLGHPPEGLSMSRDGHTMYLTQGQHGLHAFHLDDHPVSGRTLFELQRLGPPETTPKNW